MNWEPIATAPLDGDEELVCNYWPWRTGDQRAVITHWMRVAGPGGEKQ